jgi:putative transposase
MKTQLEISTSRGLSTVGHTGTFALDTSAMLSASASNALGDKTSTRAGEILDEQVMSLNKESPCL